ncbi:MAG TPA: ABC transporter ATP-binding protein [Candidatus Krumholzibacteria bacterium]|jgi:subfamily B ATP-binding cassette protein MsbA
MRLFLRLLGVLTPHKLRLILLTLAVVAAAALSSVGVTFVSPLLRILFHDETPTATVAPAAAETPADIGEGDPPLALAQLKQNVKAKVDALLDAHLYVGSRRDQLLRACMWLFLLYFAKNLATFFQEALRVDLEHRAIYEFRRRLFHAIESMPMGYFSAQRTGYLMSRVLVDVDMMRGAIVGGAVAVLSNALMIAFALTVVLAVSWKLTLATMIIVPPNALLVGYISKKLRRGSHRVQEQIGQISSILQESISGIRVVKAFGNEAREAERFEGRNLRYYKAYVKLKVVEALSSPVSEILGILTAVVILWIGGNLVLQGEMSPDLLVMFLALMLWVIAPIKQLIKVNGTIQTSLAAAERVFQILDAPREPLERDGRRDVGAPRQGLCFDGVNFSYDGSEAILRDIDLEVTAGQIVALVGPSGAGKSTMVDLVPRFYEPTSGRILLDGVDLQDIHLPTLRANIGVVAQEVILFHDTVENNLRYGRSDASKEDVERAARAANAHDFIMALPLGYDTVVGERGTRLSGGQRQRLAIARALLKDPPILIFDEATSALDSESELAVQEAMERLMAGRTTLVIAHRLSTITGADLIVVIDEGRIVERGTHAELMTRRGAYRRLYELQFQLQAADAGPPA